MKRITRGKTIVLFCHECSGWDARRRPDGKSLISYPEAGHAVSACDTTICPLWPFRTGKEEIETRPKKKDSLTACLPLRIPLRDKDSMVAKEHPKTRSKVKRVVQYGEEKINAQRR